MPHFSKIRPRAQGEASHFPEIRPRARREPSHFFRDSTSRLTQAPYFSKIRLRTRREVESWGKCDTSPLLQGHETILNAWLKAFDAYICVTFAFQIFL